MSQSASEKKQNCIYYIFHKLKNAFLSILGSIAIAVSHSIKEMFSVGHKVIKKEIQTLLEIC